MLTLVCKATYELCPEVSPLAQDQDDIHTDDIHWGADGRSSLRAPSDLVPFKRRVDVLVAGHAYAPHGRSVRSLLVRLVAGAVNKAVAVHGDQSFLLNGELSQSSDFKTIPLCWERAAGGPGTSNPAGIAPAPSGSGSGWIWVPNIQPPGTNVASARDRIAPVGLGPIAPEWPDRSQKLGRSAASWDHRNWHVHPLPDNIDAGYFNSAPLDQQVDQIAPDEHIELENLHPRHPRLVTWLDGVVPRAVLRRSEQLEQPIKLRCDTLWIDTDRGVCCVTWRGSIALEAAEGAEIHITADGRRPAPSMAESTVLLNEGLVSALRRGERTLPGSALGSANETIQVSIRGPANASPLPFVPAAPGSVLSVVSSVEIRERRTPSADPTGTLTAPLVLETKVLPFGSTGSQSTIPPASILAPIPIPEPELIAAPIPVTTPESFVTPPPPAMLTPVASAPGRASDPAPARSAEKAALVVDPEAFSIERWGEISAEIDKEHRPRAEVLHAHNLTDHDWAAVERHWKAVLAREAASGGFSLRFKHDAAYVGTLERLRDRPLSASEYAQILAASERRQVPAALRDLEMPAAAHLPIVRLWTAKLARDPKLSFEMIQAIAALREGAASPTSATS